MHDPGKYQLELNVLVGHAGDKLGMEEHVQLGYAAEPDHVLERAHELVLETRADAVSGRRRWFRLFRRPRLTGTLEVRLALRVLDRAAFIKGLQPEEATEIASFRIRVLMPAMNALAMRAVLDRLRTLGPAVQAERPVATAPPNTGNGTRTRSTVRTTPVR